VATFEPIEGWREAATKLAADLGADMSHALQVTRLALALFDELAALHKRGPRERAWLECAGLLHDVGLSVSDTAHHKVSLRLILDSGRLPLPDRERLIVANVARYHRSSLPSARHPDFAALAPEDQEAVRLLAALLRVADGLDRTHSDVVTGLACEVEEGGVAVMCSTAGLAEPECEAALRKGDLFEQVFGRQLSIVLGGTLGGT